MKNSILSFCINKNGKILKPFRQVISSSINLFFLENHVILLWIITWRQSLSTSFFKMPKKCENGLFFLHEKLQWCTVYNKTFFDLHSRNARLNHLLHWWSYKKKVYLFFKVFTSLNTRFTLEDLFCGHINKHQKYLFLNKYKSEFYLFLQTRKHLEVYNACFDNLTKYNHKTWWKRGFLLRLLLFSET